MNLNFFIRAEDMNTSTSSAAENANNSELLNNVTHNIFYILPVVLATLAVFLYRNAMGLASFVFKKHESVPYVVKNNPKKINLLFLLSSIGLSLIGIIIVVSLFFSKASKELNAISTGIYASLIMLIPAVVTYFFFKYKKVIDDVQELDNLDWNKLETKEVSQSDYSNILIRSSMFINNSSVMEKKTLSSYFYEKLKKYKDLDNIKLFQKLLWNTYVWSSLVENEEKNAYENVYSILHGIFHLLVKEKKFNTYEEALLFLKENWNTINSRK
ncbi:hypothetical protein [Mycoplasmopsis columbina]|uniref:hypothetical protein n=1 Tax=Mycoplasmopsis columbina TaxID=114881 RepID=UPI0004A716BC|nr:hypothetical protein [Mycoplasmopsis columbina]VEU77177.1 Uncharacterised protein [Mycoplasmopsis columbina]